eukprot:GHVP01042656.1.p1 GENE.GHVP01042656.1~~GHVP01042656.1.p1  ORF type:complete len:100 (-),score=16.94 GHVP01042656.1:35-334(-)
MFVSLKTENIFNMIKFETENEGFASYFMEIFRNPRVACLWTFALSIAMGTFHSLPIILVFLGETYEKGKKQFEEKSRGSEKPLEPDLLLLGTLFLRSRI